jgi:multicomponent Na+:H+ antiporter subunit A
VLALMVSGSILTFAYSARFRWGGFARKRPARGAAVAPANGAAVAPANGAAVAPVADTPFKPVGWLFLGAPALLSVLSVAYGAYPQLVEGWIAPYSAPLPAADPHPQHLLLWHGVTLPLILSAVVVAGGLALFLLRRRV